ncbi:MAG: ferrous iron transporter B [Aeromicrobium sp.]|nr:MAG: ferrous iron transporter B [Aeromicrobium sp.]
MSSSHCEPGTSTQITLAGKRRFALIGNPNSGKSTLFNALSGLSVKTGNYPGVTVAKHLGQTRVGDSTVILEDLPGTYSLDAISPDEQVVVDVLSGVDEAPDGIIIVLDSTTLQRSLGFLARVLRHNIPAILVLTFTDDLQRRGGHIDASALSRALGIRVIPATSGERQGVNKIKATLAEFGSWESPVIAPPADAAQLTAWTESVLSTASYQPPEPDRRTAKIDAVLLHPVWGTLVFFIVMFAFFQTIFAVAAPMQEQIEVFFAWLGAKADAAITIGWLGAFVSEALLGGVGGVLVFLPQIALLFVMIAILEGSGYMARAAFLMDRVMAKAGLEGRAFVSLLSSVACAIPGIMATRSLPSAKDRLATMMAAPLITCSARLPVYVLLIGLLVDPDERFGPFNVRGLILFGMYLLGAVSAMLVAAIATRLSRRSGALLPFYMEIPPYQVPKLQAVVSAVWASAGAFVRKVTSIIMVTTIVLWLLLNFPQRSLAEMDAAGVDTSSETAMSAYVLDNSYAASVGKAVEPVFAPLGFDWRINIGIVSSLAAREVFVATLGQVAAAENPDEPLTALQDMKVLNGPDKGDPLFSPSVIAALLMFFAFALQCMSTVGVLRRETGSWRWPAIAFGYMFVVAWTMAFLAASLVRLVT